MSQVEVIFSWLFCVCARQAAFTWRRKSSTGLTESTITRAACTDIYGGLFEKGFGNREVEWAEEVQKRCPYFLVEHVAKMAGIDAFGIGELAWGSFLMVQEFG